MVLVIVAGLGLGAGLAIVLWGLFPPPLTLRAALGRLTGEHTPAAADVVSQGPASVAVTIYRDDAIPDPAAAHWNAISCTYHPSRAQQRCQLKALPAEIDFPGAKGSSKQIVR